MIGTAGASLGKWARKVDANDGDPALVVDQRGSGDVLSLRDGGVVVAKVADGGAATFSGGGVDRFRINAAYNLTLFQATANYTLGWNDPAAARTLTIPDPLGNDTFVFLAATQILTNKTLTAPAINGTVTTTGLTLPAFTLGGAMDANAQNITGVSIINASDFRGKDATSYLETLYADASVMEFRAKITGGAWSGALARIQSAASPTFDILVGRLLGTLNANSQSLSNIGSAIFSGTTSGNVTVNVAAVAGTWTMTLPTGVAGVGGYQLTDAAGDGVTSWAAAGSLRAYKNILGVLPAQDALDKILDAKVYRFFYKPGMGTQDSETEYAGVVGEEAPWAMHYQGGVFNPVNAFGYTIGALQAMNNVDWLKDKVREAMADAIFKDWLKKELEV